MVHEELEKIKMTKGGVVHDLHVSPYVSEYKGLSFYFSSNFYKQKFDKTIDNYVKYETLRIANKYNVPLSACHLEDLLALSLYRQIEKRGCRIIGYDGIEYHIGIKEEPK